MPLLADPIVFARDADMDLEIPLRKASGMEAVLILCRATLLLWRGEFFLDLDAGTPWLETADGTVTERDAILGQRFDAARTARVLRQVLLAVPAVFSVPTMRCAFDGATRNLTVTFVVRCAFGDSPVTTVALAA